MMRLSLVYLFLQFEVSDFIHMYMYIFHTGENILHSVEEVRPDLGDIPIYVQGKNLLLGPGYEPWDDLMLRTDPVPVCQTHRAEINMLTPCCYIFTSGTTGLVYS